MLNEELRCIQKDEEEKELTKDALYEALKTKFDEQKRKWVDVRKGKKYKVRRKA